jgi:phospholipid/cholesterol/gamma-HCH transport system substrate-binding protein
METRASYILVGVFVILLVASGFAITIWFARVQLSQQPDYYVVNFRGSVTGLQVGSAVRYRGIPVGRVSQLRIDPDNIEVITATLELDPDTPVKEDTYAQLGIQGITGVAFVQLDGSTNDSPPLRKPDSDKVPEIPSRFSGLETLLAKAPELLDRAVTIADRLSLLLDDRNVAAFAESLENVRQITASFAAQSKGVDRQLKDLSEAVSAMRRLAQSTEKLVQQIDGRVGPLSASMEGALNEVRNAARSFSQLSRGLETMMTENREPLHDFSSQGLYEFTQFLIEARQLVAGLNRLTNQLERDPSRFLFGDTQKGYEAR